MTLIVAVAGNDFVIVGADGKGTVTDHVGNRVDSLNEQKLVKLTDFVCVLLVADGEIGLELIEEFQTRVKPKPNWGITKTVAELSVFCKEQVGSFFSGVRSSDPSFPDIIYVLAGFDKVGTKYKSKINVLRSSSMFFPGRYKDKVAEGKPLIARYILSHKYNRNLSEDDMCYLVGELFVETITLDGDVGGQIRMARLSPKVTIFKDPVVDAFTKPKEYRDELQSRELERLARS
jgi:hypothetical protein